MAEQILHKGAGGFGMFANLTPCLEHSTESEILCLTGREHKHILSCYVSDGGEPFSNLRIKDEHLPDLLLALADCGHLEACWEFRMNNTHTQLLIQWKPTVLTSDCVVGVTFKKPLETT